MLYPILLWITQFLISSPTTPYDSTSPFPLLQQDASSIEAIDCEIEKENTYLTTESIQAVNNCVERDSLALVALYNATNGPNWNITWDLTQPMHTWFGVEVNGDGCVISIDLTINNLSGNLVSELGNLANLLTLRLGTNSLTGTIPIEIFDLIGLRRLDLFNNPMILDSLPSEIGNLTNLEVLGLSNTGLSGKIPPEIGLLINLIDLRISSTNIEGVIPAEIGNLLTLENLFLSGNNLSGNIPPQIGELTNVTTLNLSNNNLEGSIPHEIGNMTALASLNLSFNNLGGTIPQEIGLLLNLSTLTLWDNDLIGPLPEEICNLENLTSMNLSENLIDGEIPQQIGQLTQLTSLNIGSNKLSGEIPSGIDLPPNLRFFNARMNKLTGRIPDDINLLENLANVTFSRNLLTGEIPNSIKLLSSLRELVLGENALKSTIPDLSQDCPNIRFFGYEQNKITFQDILFSLENNQALILSNSSFSTNYRYAPQDSIFTDTLIEVSPGAFFTLDLLIDDTVTTNIYTWFKDGIIHDTIYGINQLAFPSFASVDTGTYWVHVTNPLAPDLTLESHPIRLQIENNCRMRDSLALVALYNSTNGPDWTNTWDLSQPMDTWYGVHLNGEGCVICLNLDVPNNCDGLSTADFGNNLDGPLPPEIGMLTDLEVLVLNLNEISGEIPPEIGDLENLEVLSLFDNNLTGEIPPEIGDLENLRLLSLHENKLIGEIPLEIRNLGNLKYLALFDNGISGPIPPEIGDLDSLEFLDISSNQITGIIPDEIKNLSNLGILLLDFNQLNGAFPDLSLGCPGLWILDYHHNKFTFEDILFSYANNQDLITSNSSGYPQYAPQDSIFTDTLIEVSPGAPFTLDLLIDDTVTTNIYTWYKEGNVYDTIYGINELFFQNFTNSDTGTYWVHVTNPNVPLLILESYPIQLQSGCSPLTYSIQTTDDCNDSGNGSITISPLGEQAMLDYDWEGDLFDGDSLRTGLLQGFYAVTLSDINGCTEERSIEVGSIDIGASVEVFNSLCFGDSRGRLDIKLDNGVPPFQYWLNGIQSDSDTIFSHLPTGFYNVQVEDSQGCLVEWDDLEIVEPDSIVLEIIPDFDPVQNIYDLICEPDISSDNLEFHWEVVSPFRVQFISDPLNQNVSLKTQERAIVQITVANADGCISRAQIELEGQKLAVPEIITPNNDGVNESLVIPFLYEYEKRELAIMNRWGVEVWRSNQYEQGEWYGQNRSGAPLPDGVYYYYLKFDIPDGVIQKGYISLIR